MEKKPASPVVETASRSFEKTVAVSESRATSAGETESRPVPARVSFATFETLLGRESRHSKSRRMLPLFSWLRLTSAGLSGASICRYEAGISSSDAAILAGPRLQTRIALAKAPNHHTIFKLSHAFHPGRNTNNGSGEYRRFVFTLTVSSSHQQPLRSGLALH